MSKKKKEELHDGIVRAPDDIQPTHRYKPYEVWAWHYLGNMEDCPEWLTPLVRKQADESIMFNIGGGNEIKIAHGWWFVHELRRNVGDAIRVVPMHPLTFFQQYETVDGNEVHLPDEWKTNAPATQEPAQGQKGVSITNKKALAKARKEASN